MGIVIDLIVLAIIGLFVLICAKKGFVKTLIESVGVILAIVVAFLITQPVSEAVYDSFIEPSIIESTKEKVPDNAENVQIKIPLDDIPDYIIENAESYGVSLDEFISDDGKEVIIDGEEALQDTVNKTVKPVAVKLISAVSFLFLVIVLVIVFKILAKVLNKLFSFSVVGKLNKLLGGALGVLKGTAVAVAVCTIISILAKIGVEVLFFTAENIDNTILFKALSNILTF